MQSFRWCLALLLLAVSVLAKPEANEVGVVYALVEGAPVGLELHRPPLIRQPDRNGFSREFLKIPGSQATIRFVRGGELAWTVRSRIAVPDTCGMNWYNLRPDGFQLHRLKVRQEQRLLMLVEANPYQETEHSGLPLKVSQTDPDNLRLQAGAELEPGEYAIAYEPRNGGATVFCFAIDPDPDEL